MHRVRQETTTYEQPAGTSANRTVSFASGRLSAGEAAPWFLPVCLIVTGAVIVGLVLLGGSIDNVILHFVVMLVMPFVALVLGCVGLYFFGVKIIGGLFTYSRADSEVEDRSERFVIGTYELFAEIFSGLPDIDFF